MIESNKKNKRIAVIGAGVFGCTAAIFLAKAGFKVDLYEKGEDICRAASGINQYRLHSGYHYPRSDETISSCKEATPLFEDEYSEAVMGTLNHYYAIAKHNSQTTGDEYIRVLDRHKLGYEIVKPKHINHEAVELVIKAQEKLFNPLKLKNILLKKLADSGVKLFLNREVQVDDMIDYDKVVVATYASFNSFFGTHHESQREYQFEVCEKIVITIPDQLKNISTVIMDGPFMSFDPLGETGSAVMGHVDHAIIKRSYGLEAEIPDVILPLLNRGVIKNPAITNVDKFLETGSYFMPALKQAKHEGSMFTIRTVLPRVDDTDTRPTIINSVDSRTVTIYSGKIGNSVKAAVDVVRLLSDVNN